MSGNHGRAERVGPRMERLRLITVIALAVGLLVPASAASASCMLDERPIGAKIDEAEIVFVGQVTGLRNGDRSAQFAVEEMWKGNVPPEVVVHGGPDDPQMATSNDRTWADGQRYLVFPYTEGGRLMDNFCTPTVEWRPAFAKARPEGAVTRGETEEPSEPAAQGSEDDGDDGATAIDPVDPSATPWLPIGIGVAVVAAALAGVLVLRRRRPPAVSG